MLPAPFQELFWLFIFSFSREYDAIVLSAGLSCNYLDEFTDRGHLGQADRLCPLRNRLVWAKNGFLLPTRKQSQVSNQRLS